MANTAILSMPVATSLDGAEYIPIVQAGTNKRATAQQVANQFGNQLDAAMEYVIDGGGGTLPAGLAGYRRIPFDCSIQDWALLGDQVGSITVDLWKCTYAQFDGGVTHPVVGDSITAGSPPSMTAAAKAFSSTISWPDLELDEGDILAFYVSSVSTLTRVTVSISLNRTIA